MKEFSLEITSLLQMEQNYPLISLEYGKIFMFLLINITFTTSKVFNQNQLVKKLVCAFRHW